MNAIPRVVGAEHRGDHRIHIRFADGTSGTVDFTEWLHGPVFEPLKEVTYFQRFFVDGVTLTWPNGADIAPETLYERAIANAAA